MSADSGAPIIGGMFGAMGSLMESSDKANAYDNQATQLKNNANMEREVGAYNVMRQQIAAGKKFGSIEAGYSASGIANDSGSALSVLTASHINSEFDRLSIIHGADMRAGMMEERARQDETAAGRSRQLGYFNAFSSMFGGGAKAAMQGGGPSDRDNGFNELDSEDNGYSTGGSSRNSGNSYDV